MFPLNVIFEKPNVCGPGPATTKLPAGAYETLANTSWPPLLGRGYLAFPLSIS